MLPFYAIQGVGRLVLGLFFVVGGPGGGGFAMEVIIRGFLVFSSCLSLLTALTLYLRRGNWSQVLGEVSSLLLGGFYAWIAFGIAESIVFSAQQTTLQYYRTLAALFLNILIVVLNGVSVLHLHGKAESKSD